MTSDTTLGWDLHVVRPGLETVVLGPASDYYTVGNWEAKLIQMMVGTAHPEGTTLVIKPHDPSTCTHLDFRTGTPSTMMTVADAMVSMPNPTNPGDTFPDLYSRLKLRVGDDEADRLWRAACAEVDANAEFRDSQGKIPGMLTSVTGLILNSIDALTEASTTITTLNRDDLYEGAIGYVDAEDATREITLAVQHLRNASRIASQYASQARTRRAEAT